MRVKIAKHRYSINELIENGTIQKDADGTCYVELRNMEDLFRLHDVIDEYMDGIYGLIIDKDPKDDVHRILIYDYYME